MVNKIQVSLAEPPEKVIRESPDAEGKIRDEPTAEKLPTKYRVLHGFRIFTAIIALVLVVTLPIVLKRSPEARESQKWGDWTEWSRCTSTCGKGQRSRIRFCGNGKNHNRNEINCRGESEEIEICHLVKCLSGRSMVKSICTHLRQSLNMTDNLFCDRYAQSVTLNGNVINSVGAVERGYGVWRLTETNYYQMVERVCGDIPGFSPSNTLNYTLNLLNE